MASAFHSHAHTPLLFVGLQGVEPRGSWTTRLQRAPAPYRSRAPKRRKKDEPPRSPWVAPFLGMFHLLLERSPPSGVLDAILGREDVARLRAHAQTHGKQRVRVPGPCLFAMNKNGGQPGRLRCEFRGPHWYIVRDW